MKVLVAVDHKPSSQAIIDALIKMHWPDGTELHVVTVRQNSSEAEKSADAGTVTLSDIEEVAADLQAALPHCRVFFLAPHGEPRSAILDFMAELRADLIMMGSNCKNTLERLLIGSVCQAVLSDARCPVIVAKTPCCLAREASPAFKNILVPIDNSVYSDVAVRWLANFDWAPDCRFILTAAVEEDTNMRSVRESLLNRASELSKFIGPHEILIETVLGEPRKAIVELAKKHYADLIVMGSHGRTGLKKLVLGSVAHGVSHDAPCAVAVVRGIVPDDESWKRTGAFEKLEPVPINVLAARAGYRRSDDTAPSVMPGGM